MDIVSLFSFVAFLVSLFTIPHAFSSSAIEVCQDQAIRKKCRPCCRGRRGPDGVAGLSEAASYQWSVAPCTTPFALSKHQPIPFFRQLLLEGDAIQSTYPYDGFTLAQGDYQIEVGLANNGGILGPVSNLQLTVFLNNRLLFVWPALSGASTAAPPFITLSTIFSVVGSSAFLQIFSTQNVEYDETEIGGTIAFLNIYRISRDKDCVEL